MSLKNEIFKQLKEREGEYVSGQSLAETFGVSRAAVWKAIDALRKEGYALSGTPKAGYVLSPSDVLREEELSAALEEAGINGIKLYVFEALPSTNLRGEAGQRGRFLAHGGRGGQANAGREAPRPTSLPFRADCICR
ncbi:MAG: HTH domain-containing protein [Christensenellaceae bacterium]